MPKCLAELKIIPSRSKRLLSNITVVFWFSHREPRSCPSHIEPIISDNVLLISGVVTNFTKQNYTSKIQLSILSTEWSLKSSKIVRCRRSLGSVWNPPGRAAETRWTAGKCTRVPEMEREHEHDGKRRKQPNRKRSFFFLLHIITQYNHFWIVHNFYEIHIAHWKFVNTSNNFD